ncbi:GtrA family protein [Desulfurococcus amylolyticus]|uniref:GtrA family protein n=1 Tax=Desulfurococcus amylolyticus TaxID=94694 RepID=UPI000321CE85|nr:GtrA family protein [Desulfurococcus amylolyticus]
MLRHVYKELYDSNGFKYYVLKGFEDLVELLRGKGVGVVVYLRVGLLDKLVFKLLGIPVYICGDRVILGFSVGSKDPGVPICGANEYGAKAIELGVDAKLRLYSLKLPRMLALPLSEINRVAKFIVVGASGVVINVSTAIFSRRLLIGLDQFIANPLASSIGFESSIIWNFVLHEEWTFKEAGLNKGVGERLKRLVKYHLASAASWASQAACATLLPAYLATPFWAGQVIGVLIGFALNFLLGYIYTWSWSRLR